MEIRRIPRRVKVWEVSHGPKGPLDIDISLLLLSLFIVVIAGYNIGTCVSNGRKYSKLTFVNLKSVFRLWLRGTCFLLLMIQCSDATNRVIGPPVSLK